MSLINDALKRAQEAQRPDRPSSVSSIRTIEAQPEKSPLTGRILVVIIFLLLAAAFAFFGLAMTGRLAKKKMADAQVSAPRPTTTPAPAAPVTAQPVAPAAVVVAPAQLAPAKVATVPAPAPVLPPLVLPEDLHVQGLAYDPVRPWAIVSGKMVYVGDVVKGVRVMTITRDCVVFGNNGQTNLLYVGQ
jgi:hypothetical protein